MKCPVGRGNACFHTNFVAMVRCGMPCPPLPCPDRCHLRPGHYFAARVGSAIWCDGADLVSLFSVLQVSVHQFCIPPLPPPSLVGPIFSYSSNPESGQVRAHRLRGNKAYQWKCSSRTWRQLAEGTACAQGSPRGNWNGCRPKRRHPATPVRSGGGPPGTAPHLQPAPGPAGAVISPRSTGSSR